MAGGRPAKTVPFGSERRYGQEELRELREALEQGTLIYASGKKVKQLESEFAALTGHKFAIATSSGTSAIHTALMAAGISPGDEVIVPPITDMGSIFPVMFQGAIPVFADLDPRTYNLSPAAVEAAITTKTRAILAVHLAGNPCDMSAIAAARGIAIIEDCAQAHGAIYQQKPVGHFGIAGCYSLNEFKHISCGDGGVVVTDDAAFAAKARFAMDKGYNRQPNAAMRAPTFLANNYRMTELQGAVAIAQVKKLPSIIERRRRFCSELSKRLAGLPGLSLPAVTPGGTHSWWFYMMRVDPAQLATADEFAAALKAEGLPVGAHYHGKPVYLYPLFANHSAFDHAAHPFAARNYAAGLCPVAEKILETCVTLAINEAYTAPDLDETVHAITRVTKWLAARNH